MRDTILCLCDLTGIMARPWVEHGYQAVLVDPQHGFDHEDGAYLKLACTIEEAFDQISVLVRSGRLAFVAGFPPCTDMAVSGAQWFPRKYEADHMFQAKAVSVAEQCRVIGEMSGVPYMVENPVSVLSNVFGKPSHTFNPCDYTRFAPEDNYTKKTCLWTGGGIPNASSQPGHESASSRTESYLVHERQGSGQQSQQNTTRLRPSSIRIQPRKGKGRMSYQEIYFGNPIPADDVGQVCFRRFSDGDFQVYTDCDPDSETLIAGGHGNLSTDDAIMLAHWLIDQLSIPQGEATKE